VHIGWVDKAEGKCYHVLMKVNIHLVMSESCLNAGEFDVSLEQIDRGMQGVITLQDWSPISTAPDVNSALEFFHRNLLSVMHR